MSCCRSRRLVARGRSAGRASAAAARVTVAVRRFVTGGRGAGRARAARARAAVARRTAVTSRGVRRARTCGRPGARAASDATIAVRVDVAGSGAGRARAAGTRAAIAACAAVTGRGVRRAGPDGRSGAAAAGARGAAIGVDVAGRARGARAIVRSATARPDPAIRVLVAGPSRVRAALRARATATGAEHRSWRWRCRRGPPCTSCCYRSRNRIRRRRRRRAAAGAAVARLAGGTIGVERASLELALADGGAVAGVARRGTVRARVTGLRCTGPIAARLRSGAACRVAAVSVAQALIGTHQRVRRDVKVAVHDAPALVGGRQRRTAC